jgi:hypothetical protein
MTTNAETYSAGNSEESGRPIIAPPQIRYLSQPIVVTSILHGAEIARVIRDEQKLTNAIIRLSQ